MKDYKPLVSVIIPAYNVESYIEKAIQSVFEQTYENVELIIIDDGSSDKTCFVIEKIIKYHKDVIFFKQNNYGVSIARNKGIELASGHYCVFLDADDCLRKNALETLLKYKFLNKDSLIICNRIIVNINNKNNNNGYSNEISINKHFSTNDAINNFNTYKLDSSCFKLFDLKIIKENNIKFPNGLTNGEDGLFVFRYLQYIDDIFYFSEPLWIIFERPNSASRQEFSTTMLSSIKTIEMMIEENKKYKSKENIRALNKMLISKLILLSYRSFFSSKTTYYDRLYLHHKLKHILIKTSFCDLLNKTGFFWLLYLFFPSFLLHYFKIKDYYKSFFYRY